MDTQIVECATSLARAELYAILARVLAGPAQCLETALYRDFGRIAAESGTYGPLKDEAAALESLARDLSKDPRRVAQEYTSLFDKTKAPPYETSYIPSVRVTQELADISAFFRAFGLRPRGERPDHIVSELEWMSVVCLKESIAAGNDKVEEAAICRQAQAKFLQDHLGRWLRIYRSLLEGEATIPLYPRLAGLAHALVRIDARDLGLELEEITEVARSGDPDVPRCGTTR